MGAKEDRIIGLQRQVKIAVDALTRIRCGQRDPELVAENALDAIWKQGPKQPLQGIVGHEPRRSI